MIWTILLIHQTHPTLAIQYLGGKDSVYVLGGSEINKVQKLKYLGVGLNSKGARAHDKAKEAEAHRADSNSGQPELSWERGWQLSSSDHI